jgi:hypothetical protein
MEGTIARYRRFFKRLLWFSSMPVLKQMVRYAKSSGKSGVSAFGDMGSFFYRHNRGELLDYELSLPSEYDSKMNLKTFCLYHQKEFDLKFRETKRAVAWTSWK